MVEVLRGRGEHFRDFAQKMGIDSRLFGRSLRFNQEDSSARIREEEALMTLQASPEFDQNSIFLTNVTYTDGAPIDVLLVPEGCPSLISAGESLSENLPNSQGILPKEGETYVARAWKKGMPKNQMTILVLVDNPRSAFRIARRNASDMIGGGFRRAVGVDVSLVSPEEFIEIAKNLIDQGQELSDRILRYADLREYAWMRQQNSLDTLKTGSISSSQV